MVSGTLFLVVGVSTVRETYHVWQVDQDIRSLQSQVELLEGKKLSFLDTIQRLNSPDSLDKEARARLGLRKPGERVIVLSGMGDQTADVSAQATVPSESTEAAPRPPSNLQKWFRYFIHP
jgi:hypothetical protein